MQLQIGSRCKLRDIEFEIIGYMERKDSTRQYCWGEYLLMNPYLGFAWLVDNERHWTFIQMIKTHPLVSQETAYFHNHSYKRFLTDSATVSFVLGEFYWRVATWDTTDTIDFVAPPFVLSVEQNSDEIVWSQGEYITTGELESSFKDDITLQCPYSVGMNQPNPWSSSVKEIMTPWIFTLLASIAIFASTNHRTQPILDQRFLFTPGSAQALSNAVPAVGPIVVTQPFEVGPGTTNLEISLAAPIENQWLATDLTLVNSATQEAFEGDHVRELLQDLGVITGFNEHGAPQYEQLYLCHAPEERLYQHGRWQGGLLPSIGVTENDRLQYRRFFQLIDDLKHRKGSDGRPLFAVPLRLSSKDKEFLDLDKITFADYLKEHSYTSKPLLWYLDYCCRDDFGALSNAVSAWAGLHYFASRRPWNGNHEETQLLTWPEGNGWLVKELAGILKDNISTSALAFDVACDANMATVTYFDLNRQESVTVEADYVLYCAPRFTIPYVIPSLREKKDQIIQDCHYSPWMVANITVREDFNRNQRNLAWDNVIYQGKGLGYVDSSHQLLTTSTQAKVLTYYSALSSDTPQKERTAMANRTYHSWGQEILSDLRGPHPDLHNQIEQLDVWLWAHGMIRPTPDYIWNLSEKALTGEHERLFFAHSDLSGISIFEEAQYQGVEKAKRLLQLMGA